MKKILLTIAVASTMLVANAQSDMMSKKGTPILPEAGDWSIGINANPFLEYVGNIFNTAHNAAPSFDYTGNHPLILNFKMVKNETTAYRAIARITFGSMTNTAAPDTTSGSLKDSTISTFGVVLGLGIQKTRGKGRLKGVYGAEANIAFGNAPGEGKVEYTYNGTTPTGATTEIKSGSGFGIGVRGFLGVEYFFAPKMSLSGEYGWGIMFNSVGAGSVTLSDGTSHDTGKQSTFGIGSDTGSGSINFNFYF